MSFLSDLSTALEVTACHFELVEKSHDSSIFSMAVRAM